MLKELRGGVAEVRSRVLEDEALPFVLLLEGGTRGDRRDGVNVELLIRAGMDLRCAFFGGMVNDLEEPQCCQLSVHGNATVNARL